MNLPTTIRRTLQTLCVFVVVLLAACKTQPAATLPHDVLALQQQGVVVAKVGESVDLYVPTDALFTDNSANFLPNAETLLNPIVNLLRAGEIADVKVAGYTDDKGWTKRKRALSEKQAQRVANYLWAQGVTARMISAAGYNGKHPIASNAHHASSHLSHRIEISYRYLPPL